MTSNTGVTSLGIQLTREDTSTGRYYKVSNTGLRYASVTTLISKFKDDFSTQRLKEWEEKIGTEEANKVRENSARRGTRVHKALEDTLTGKSLSLSLDENELPYYSNIMPCFSTGIMKPVMLEEPIYWHDPNNKTIGFGGTADSLLRVNLGRLIFDDSGLPVGEGEAHVLGDFKTWKTAKYPRGLLDVYMQLAAYCAGINQLSNTYYKLNKGLIIGATPKKLYLYYLDMEAIMFYWQEFKLLCESFYGMSSTFNWKAYSCKAQDLQKIGDKWVEGIETKVARKVVLDV